MKTIQRLAKINRLLVAIAALGLGLRIWGINFGLPYTYAPDEPTHLSIALHIFKTGDLNPYWLNYPSLMFYLNALAYIPFFFIGKLFGALATPSDIPYPEILATGVGRAAMPSEFLLSRGLTAIFGTASIFLVYLIGRESSRSKWAALAAALLFAVSPANVFNSHLIRPDTLAVFFVLFSVFWARGILDEPNLRNYVLAGAGAGLAVSSKYNVGLILLPFVAAHFLSCGAPGLRRKELYIGIAASVFAFLLTTPFALLDSPRFFRDMGFEVAAQAEGHAGFEGNTAPWYLDFLWSSEGILTLCGVLQALYLFWTRSKNGIVVLVFPVIYFIFINQFIVRNDRTILPVIPFLDILAAMFLLSVFRWLNQTQYLSRQAISAICIAIFAWMIFTPLQSAIASDARLNQTDSRETARVWIERNLPRGSRIALEAYSPYVDRQHFMVEGFDGLIDRPPDWYVQNGFEYLVFSYGAYGRFYENRALYSEFASRYDIFFSTFPQVMRFNDNGYEIRILKTNTDALPAQRVAARFGIYSNWLEMVGYDVDASRWQIGASADFTFYWRSVATRREPLRLTVRLLDRLDHEVTQSSGDLFPEIKSDGRWPEGIARVPWKIAAPINAAPGMYRLELDVDAGEIGRVPVLSLNREPLSDKLFIGPFKISPAAPSQNELQSAQRVSANFGDALFLLGYSMQSPALRPGDALALTLYWKSAAKIDRDYTVFVHLIDSDGRVRAQMDAQPFGGAYPTSLWDTGEVARDDYDLNLPRDLAPGTFRIEVGLYEYPSLARLPVMDADGKNLGDHLVLKETIQVAR